METLKGQESCRLCVLLKHPARCDHRDCRSNFHGSVYSFTRASGQTFLYTKQYSLILFVGGASFILNFALEQLVRSEGASKESMYGMFVMLQ